MSNPVVIDISHWQADPIDWATLKAAGTIGIIHKASEGLTYVDPKLFARAKAAKAAGLCWSTYHYLQPGNMTGQMDHYLKTVDPVEGERVCLDHEETKVSLSDLEACVTYLGKVRPDLQITIYSGHVIKDQLGSQRSEILAASTSLWIAQYTSAASPSWPQATWPTWSLWQYTDQAPVKGYASPVDGNRWNGSTEALKKWFGPVGASLPDLEPIVPMVTVNMSVPEGVAMTVIVNGIPVAMKGYSP